MSNPGLKVSDLLNLQQSIERDLGELNETLKRIPSDRDYSLGIQNSIENEIYKLGELQKELLDIEISIEDPFADTQKIEKVIRKRIKIHICSKYLSLIFILFILIIFYTKKIKYYY